MHNTKTHGSYGGTPVSYLKLQNVVDEAHKYGASVTIRGGEPFLYSHIIDLLAYIKSKGMYASVETNGTLLKKHAESLVKLRLDSLLISVDGPEEIHDYVRGVKGAFAQIREGLEEIAKYETEYSFKIHRSITCTLSGYNYLGLGEMPDVARALDCDTICVIPFCYIPEKQGLAYEQLMNEQFSSKAFSWRGFHHETSGVDVKKLVEQLKIFKLKLHDLKSYPYMDFTEDEYREWFKTSATTVHQSECNNIYNVVDIQPNGQVNFCIDFPDYVIGNIATDSLYQIWHSERARQFRHLRANKEMPICYRCASKYLGFIR